MTELSLRDYQTEVIADLRRSIAEGDRRPLLVAPTGAGKTIIASAIIKFAVERGKRVLFLAHRRELIQQAADKLWQACGIEAGIIMAGHDLDLSKPVQVASIQTLWSRTRGRNAMELPPADLIIPDEAHRCRSRTYLKILEDYPDAVILGLTATPCRGDGRGLGNIFDRLVECPSVPELIKLGFLVPTVVYAPPPPDLSSVETQRGDYVGTQLAEAMDQPTLTGDIILHWLRLASDRKTVVFASGVQHSIHLRDEFRRAGVMAEHIDGNTAADERDAILKRLSEGQVQVVCNYGVLTEGWDQPDVSCCVLARPTKHMGLYRQMVGRVLRPAPGKTDALVLDHAGTTYQHGFVDEPVSWTLEEDKRAENPKHSERSGVKDNGLKDCPECGALRAAGKPCGACGWQPTRKALAAEVAEGDLARLDRDGKVKQLQWNRTSFYQQLLAIADERGYRKGWAAHKYKEKFGTWPNGIASTPETPSPEVRAWVKSRQIAFAKAKERGAA